MIKNLPNRISLESLNRFNFGNIEANEDKLLFDSTCHTKSIIEFLYGEKQIVIGEKGTGKTALFRLLKEKKIQIINSDEKTNNIIITIDDNFQYRFIKNRILQIISSTIPDELFKYQIIWELYIYHKIINHLSQQIPSLPKNLKKTLRYTNRILGKEDGSLAEIFLNLKRTIGIKLYSTPSDIFPVLPNFYASTEPSDNIPRREKKIEEFEIDLDYYKQQISNFLESNSLKVIVLFDRLDEFVSKDETEIQIGMLNALIDVEREYYKYSNIELKIFLRDDLFQRLSSFGIGYDKILHKSIRLDWTDEAIREFIARRILYNFRNIFLMESIRFSDQDESIQTTLKTKNQTTSIQSIFTKIYRNFLIRLNPHQYFQTPPREINLDDNVNKQIILTIFPRFVDHINADGENVEMDIFDFFSTHFKLGTDNTIPRFFIIFLNKVFYQIKEYYALNRDKLPELDQNSNCYHIVKSGFFTKAYHEFQMEVYTNFAKLDRDFESLINTFREKRGKRVLIKAKELKQLLEINNDELFSNFCNYMEHVGIFKSKNNFSNIDKKVYEIPILFRFNDNNCNLT